MLLSHESNGKIFYYPVDLGNTVFLSSSYLRKIWTVGESQRKTSTSVVSSDLLSHVKRRRNSVFNIIITFLKFSSLFPKMTIFEDFGEG